MPLVVNYLPEFAVLVDLVKMRLYYGACFLNLYLRSLISCLIGIIVMKVTFLLIFFFFLEKPFSQQARFFFQQLISGVSYCHAMVWWYLSLILHLTLWSLPYIHIAFTSGNLSQGSEVGKHIIGWKSNTTCKNMWLRLL